MNRRRFFSTLLAAGAAAPVMAQQASTPPRIDRLRLDAAESIFGVDFTEAEEQMALGSVNRNLDSYDQLRKLNVPLDTEPAITFRPYLPGSKPTGRSTPGAKLKVTRPVVPANLTPDQIAFLPVTALATLIETKRITSTELTKIYLDRLKKHGDTLKCVVTLTEELALQQAVVAVTGAPARAVGAGCDVSGQRAAVARRERQRAGWEVERELRDVVPARQVEPWLGAVGLDP